MAPIPRRMRARRGGLMGHHWQPRPFRTPHHVPRSTRRRKREGVGNRRLALVEHLLIASWTSRATRAARVPACSAAFAPFLGVHCPFRRERERLQPARFGQPPRDLVGTTSSAMNHNSVDRQRGNDGGDRYVVGPVTRAAEQNAHRVPPSKENPPRRIGARYDNGHGAIRGRCWWNKPLDQSKGAAGRSIYGTPRGACQ